MESVEGFGCAQIYAPQGKEFVALEPMTAPTNALRTGLGLLFAEAKSRFRTAFRIRVENL